MLQVAQNYKSGRISLEDVEPPALRSGGILVRTGFSVISAGTEAMKVREAKMSLIEKARARPDQVRQVLDTARQMGIVATYQKVLNRLDSLTPLGYATAGTVEAVGRGCEEFVVGQRVACAGAGYANHAELNFVPKNLAAAVPDGLPLEQAAFATIGAVAMHAVRQSEVRLGETAVVIGLGLIGQVCAQLLRAAGTRVIGLDPSEERRALAQKLGAEVTGSPEDDDWQELLLRQTGGHGADHALLTVGVDSNGPLELAAKALRDRGRVVVVGKTGLGLDYNTFFRKELDVRFSRSYGPGRYDSDYEEKGRDYPIGYVRWTEARNLEAFLELLARGQVDVAALTAAVHPFSGAVEIYERMHAGTLPGVANLFSYPAASQAPAAARPARARVASAIPKVRLGVIGAGNYACSMLLPHFARHGRVQMDVVATATSLSAENARRKFCFGRATTDYAGILSDPAIDAVVIATRHQSHAAMVAEALIAGKAVFVEKPLAIDGDGVALVRDARQQSGNDRLLVGFNRRHSKFLADIKANCATGAPVTVTYRVSAGRLAKDSWVKAPEEGGRFIGEAGHFLDVFSFLIGESPAALCGATLRPASPGHEDLDTVGATLTYPDGSMAILLYATQGSSALPKERIEVFARGQTIVGDNFREIQHFTSAGKLRRLRGYAGDKGQESMVDHFVRATLAGLPYASSFDELIAITEGTILAQEAALSCRPVRLEADQSR